MDYLTHHYKNLSEQLQAKVNHLHHLIRLSEENYIPDPKKMEKFSELKYEEKEKYNPKPKVKENNLFQPRNDKPKPIDSDDYDKAPKVKFKDEDAKRAEISIKKPEPRREPGDSGDYDKGPIKPKPKFDVSNNRRTEI